jgi:hypothetical protein
MQDPRPGPVSRTTRHGRGLVFEQLPPTKHHFPLASLLVPQSRSRLEITVTLGQEDLDVLIQGTTGCSGFAMVPTVSQPAQGSLVASRMRFQPAETVGINAIAAAKRQLAWTWTGEADDANLGPPALQRLGGADHPNPVLLLDFDTGIDPLAQFLGGERRCWVRR